MDRDSNQDRVKGRLNYVAAKKKERPTDVVVYALDADGHVLDEAQVNARGVFRLSAAALEEAAEIKFGPPQEDPARSKALKQLRVEEVARKIEIGEAIDVAEAVWRPWFPITLCVGGSVKKCWLFPGVLTSKLALASPSRSLAPAPGVSVPLALAESPFVHSYLPFCVPVCHGIVEVYRRQCCCSPLVVYDPRIDLVIERLEEIEVPIEVGPIPDPPPVDVVERVFTGGAEDQLKVNAHRDLVNLKALAPAERVEYIEARDYLAWLYCFCSTPVKVADGFLDDGQFDICWKEPLRLIPLWCYERYAYVVKQSIDGATVTIYDGVAAGDWYTLQQRPTLVSYHPEAIGCTPRPDPPLTGAWVYLQDVGGAGAYRLHAPDQTSPNSVGPLSYNSGLLDPAANPLAAKGKLLDRNLGGTLWLRYHFSESLAGSGVDARYYRISVAEANNAGGPAGPWKTVAPTEWRYVRWTGTTLIPLKRSLGPHSVGAENGLFEIPYDSILASNEEWQDGQFHAQVESTGFADERHLVRIEVFDGSGQRLKPTGSTGAGADKPFKYYRWQEETGPTGFDEVDYAALTNMMWWDNRRAGAKIEDVLLDGAPGMKECLFLVGTAANKVAVSYRAYHPEPKFLWRYSLTLRRGLGGPSWSVANDGLSNAGQPPGLPHTSLQKPLSDLLSPDPPGPSKCSFAIVLGTLVKTTNGFGRLNALDKWDHGSFAAEMTP